MALLQPPRWGGMVLAKSKKTVRPFLPRGLIVSPLATLALEPFAVGDTGLKIRWVCGTLRTSLVVSVPWYTCYSLAPENLCLSTKSRAHHFTAVLSKFYNFRMAPLDDYQFCKFAVRKALNGLSSSVV